MNAIEQLIEKEAIRELVLKYSRGVDRQNVALLRQLYTADATDTHGNTFDGSASDYIDFLEKSLPYLAYSGHHVCNHMISIDGREGNGEVYAMAIHVIPDGHGGFVEDTIFVRYIDCYRKCDDDQWRFSKRTVTYDYRKKTPVDASSLEGLIDRQKDPSYHLLDHTLFKFVE